MEGVLHETPYKMVLHRTKAYIYIKEDAGVSRIDRFSFFIFLKFRIDNIIIIQKIKFNTILMRIQFFSYLILKVIL